MFAGGAVALLVARFAGLNSWITVAVIWAWVVAVVAIDHFASPIIERWRQGARGEELVGEVIDSMRDSGWLALHDIDTGRGNIDHVLIGPAGVFSIETKSHRGRLGISALDQRMLKQAYAQAKLLERITAMDVEPLLVFSRAYLTPAVSRRQGVAVLPARMLRGHLACRQRLLSDLQVTEVHARLLDALAHATERSSFGAR
jgi:Nuclease-related domain